ncbi:MAG: response regulator [Flavisolibacter sp.]|jgi:CheY-like chemotaxis protein|nr:response regulator [Flavisolibacter sp.]
MKTECKSILYVDDDPDDREFLFNAIKNINPDIEVILADNGLAALDYLKNIKNKKDLPGLIVLDLNMPLLDGRETLKRIKDDPILSSVKVVVFTTGENPNEKQSFNELGIQYISKPFNIQFLHSIANQMIEICE